MPVAATAPPHLVCVLLLVAAGRALGQGAANETTTAATPAVGSEEWAFHQAGVGRCKILFTSSYGYRQFFPVGDAASVSDKDPMEGSPSPLQPGAQPKGKRLLLRFQVMADSDAHILMSAQRRSDREAYEVVLGAGANTYSDFRRLPASIPPKRAFNYSTSVVSGTELRAFWLVVDLGTGELAVGPEGGAPILSWVDPDPIQVRYFSLCTWTDVHGTWLYGCNGAGPSEALDSEELSPSERVLQDVVTPRKKAAPDNPTAVSAHLTVDRFHMDDRSGVLSLFGAVLAEWQDNRLAWPPANFSGLNATAVALADVWSPDLRVENSVLQQAPLLSPVRSRLQLDSSGGLQCRSPVLLQARCSLAADSYRESYKCVLRLATSHPTHLTLQVDHEQRKLSADWEWTGLSMQEAEDPDDDGSDSEHRGRLVRLVSVRLRYRGSRLSCVFLAAFTAVCVCCVLSLLSPVPWDHPGSGPAPSSRRLLASLTLLMNAVALISLQAALPPALLTIASFAVTSLAVALALAAGALVFPMSVAAVLDAGEASMATTATGSYRGSRGIGLPALSRRLHRLIRSPALSRLLLCRPEAEKPARWRESADTPEQALQMLKEWDSEETSKDWKVLSMVVERVCTIACLIFTLTAMVPTLVQTK